MNIKKSPTKRSSSSMLSFSKKKEVIKTTSELCNGTKKDFQTFDARGSFQISCKDNDSQSDDSGGISDGDMKPQVIETDDNLEETKSQLIKSNQANEMMPESANMQDKVAAALLTDIKTVNKIEEKKLLKYNNLYDKLRKKQDELQIL